MREGFKETFQPLIETQEAVKESIDKEQNAMIEQLQKNQEALTEGLDKNRLAITSGFDKMDEVKRWDLDQLPGIEAIEEPEKETFKPVIEGEKITYKISNRDLNKIVGNDIFNENEDAFFTKEQLNEKLDEYKFKEQDKYDINERFLSPNLVKIELVPKLKDDTIYKISVNDFFRIKGEENRLKEKDGEKKFKDISERELDKFLKESFDESKYRLEKDRDLKIVRILKKTTY